MSAVSLGGGYRAAGAALVVANACNEASGCCINGLFSLFCLK